MRRNGSFAADQFPHSFHPEVFKDVREILSEMRKRDKDLRVFGAEAHEEGSGWHDEG